MYPSYLFLLALCCSVTLALPLTETAERVAAVAAHNSARADAVPIPDPSLLPLAYDISELEVFAGGYTDNCVFQHSQESYDGDYGENLFAGSGDQIAAQGGIPELMAFAIGQWENEELNWTPNGSGGVCTQEPCGHYTAMVWEDTSLVGCGYAVCETGTPFDPQFGTTWTVVSCNYHLPGNFVGRDPYESTGSTPCGGCASTQTCVESVCTNNCDLCAVGQECVDDQCIEASAELCGGVECTAEQTCIEDVCVNNNELCDGVLCGENQTCIGDVCVNELCDGVECTAEQTCIDDVCVNNSELCDGVQCTAEQTCIEDVCVNNSELCDGVLCGENQTCIEDVCIDNDPCDLCGSEEFCVEEECCDPSEQCTDLECGFVAACGFTNFSCGTCESGFACSGSNTCDPIADPCGGVECGEFSECIDQACLCIAGAALNIDGVCEQVNFETDTPFTQEEPIGDAEFVVENDSDLIVTTTSVLRWDSSALTGDVITVAGSIQIADGSFYINLRAGQSTGTQDSISWQLVDIGGGVAKLQMCTVAQDDHFCSGAAEIPFEMVEYNHFVATVSISGERFASTISINGGYVWSGENELVQTSSGKVSFSFDSSLAVLKELVISNGVDLEMSLWGCLSDEEFAEVFYQYTGIPNAPARDDGDLACCGVCESAFVEI